MAVDASDRILFAGRFGTINGEARENIVRFNAIGSVDTTFQASVIDSVFLFGGGPRAMVAQPDGKVLIGGFFDEVNGQAQAWLARLNVNATMQDFANAVNAADMKTFYSNAPTTFRIRHSVDGLEQAFGQYFSQGDFSKRTSVAPGLAKPTLKDNFMTVEGGYLGGGYKTRFSLDYVSEEGAWKIIGFGLSLNPDQG